MPLSIISFHVWISRLVRNSAFDALKVWYFEISILLYVFLFAVLAIGKLSRKCPSWFPSRTIFLVHFSPNISQNIHLKKGLPCTHVKQCAEVKHWFRTPVKPSYDVWSVSNSMRVVVCKYVHIVMHITLDTMSQVSRTTLVLRARKWKQGQWWNTTHDQPRTTLKYI